MTTSAAQILSQVAYSTTSHKKNALALLSLLKKNAAFSTMFEGICRILDAKKGNKDAANVMTFVTFFFEFIGGKTMHEVLRM